jgi:hypothetical protein
MASPPTNLIVKPHRPARTRLLALVIALAGLVLLYGVFEFGRLRGGYDLIASHEKIAQRDREIVRLNRKLAQERDQVVLLQTSKDIDGESYQQIEQRLQVLQGTIQAQAEDLAFYKGIIAPEDGVAGLKIQRLGLRPGAEPRQFLVKLVLIQAKDHGMRVSGVVELTIDGKRKGQTASIDLKTLRPAGSPESSLGFSFRYFQELEELVVLPGDFEPETVNVEVRPKGRSARTIRQSFPWQTQ